MANDCTFETAHLGTCFRKAMIDEKYCTYHHKHVSDPYNGPGCIFPIKASMGSNTLRQCGDNVRSSKSVYCSTHYLMAEKEEN